MIWTRHHTSKCLEVKACLRRRSICVRAKHHHLSTFALRVSEMESSQRLVRTYMATGREEEVKSLATGRFDAIPESDRQGINALLV